MVRRQLLLVVVACAGLSACGAETVSIHEVYGTADSTTLEVGVQSCGANVTVEVEETADVVRLTARAENGTSGDCQDGATVDLDRALGERAVVDTASGQELTVAPPD